MSPEEKEFRELAKRYVLAGEYEKKQYLNDIPEAKEWAENAFHEITDRMSQLWILMTEAEKQECLVLLEVVDK